MNPGSYITHANFSRLCLWTAGQWVHLFKTYMQPGTFSMARPPKAIMSHFAFRSETGEDFPGIAMLGKKKHDLDLSPSQDDS